MYIFHQAIRWDNRLASYTMNIQQDTLFPKFINVHDNNSSNIESVQNHFDSETMRNKVALQEGTIPSPESIPSEPTFPRAFVEFGNSINEKDIFVTFRWKQPEFTIRTIKKYRVQYWFIENLKRIQTNVDIIPTKILQHEVYDLKPDTMYYFKVQAYNEVGAGPYTKFINVSTTHENPIPRLFSNTFYGTDVLDMDLQDVFEFKDNNDDGYLETVYSALEHKVYGITFEYVLMSCDFNLSAIGTKSNCTKIDQLVLAHSLCIDWVARNLYWINLVGEERDIVKLDLTLWQMGIIKYENIQKIDEHLFSTALPFTEHFYWMKTFSKLYIFNEFMIMTTNFDGKNMKPIWKIDNKICFCPYELIEPAMEIDHTNIDKPLMYCTSKNRLFVVDIYGCRCNQILSAGNNKIFFRDLAIDKTNIYLVSDEKNITYILKKKFALLESTENAFKHVQKVHIKLYYDQTWGSKIRAFGKSLQPYPPTICLIPNLKDYHVKEKTITANSIIVSLPEPIPNDGCKKYNLATTIYTISVSYLTCLDNDLNKIKEFNVQTYKRHYEIQNLMPFTEYMLKLALSNFYVDMLSMGLQFGANVKLKTTLNAPENVTVQVLTPTLATVYWMPLTKLNCVAVNYEVHWVPVLFPNSTQKITYQMPRDKQLIKSDRTTYGKLSMTIQPLLPGQEYFIYVRAYPANFSDIFNDSLSKSIHMYSEPNNLNLSGVSTNSMNISWIPSVNLTIQYTLEYKNDAMQKWQKVNNTKENNDEVTYYIENLLPRTLYNFRLILRYPKYMEDFIWPPDGEEFIFETLEYDEEISIGPLYNKDDVSSASGISTVTESIEISAMQYYLPLILSFVVIVVIYVCYFYYSYRRRKENNEQVLSPIIELAALYEMPYGKVQLNALYAPKSQYNPDEFALTIIKEKQITLAKLLGSGAFGKVFQGTLKNLEGLDTTPVAIKMLRKNASSREKKKFLQEAKLMSHFRHKNVLRLLGICLDAHSPLLILELMEAGDLLKYLRESRTLQPSDLCALRLQDLLAMCDDVARGCCYLEKQHFVHRDLACRNCLISAKNRENRIVKIGDFGLARDIYRDDYYRMKGEGLLPVRWMAPESLMDGIFTSKSDVWAFGVLMWEISSLGQQPYCAKTNSEVLQYVCAGGKLPKPLNCPPTLYQLMQQCWSAVDDRPNFILCLENIETLKDNIGDAILSSVDIIRHAELPLSGQIEDVGSTASRTFEPLTANDASNDVIEPLT